MLLGVATMCGTHPVIFTSMFLSRIIWLYWLGRTIHCLRLVGDSEPENHSISLISCNETSRMSINFITFTFSCPNIANFLVKFKSLLTEARFTEGRCQCLHFELLPKPEVFSVQESTTSYLQLTMFMRGKMFCSQTTLESNPKDPQGECLDGQRTAVPSSAKLNSGPPPHGLDVVSTS